MKERPILFSAPMVRAILAGAKTQTRRIVRWPNEARPVDGVAVEVGEAALVQPVAGGSYAMPMRIPVSPGDRLWVRETWSHDAASVEEARARHEDALGCGGESMPCGPYYRATEVAPDTLRWIPSIHMPRWASRILLEVTDVRVERLHAITDDDAVREGIRDRRDAGIAVAPPTLEFAVLWERINGDGAWDANPWVWVVSFERIELSGRSAETRGGGTSPGCEADGPLRVPSSADRPDFSEAT